MVSFVCLHVRNPRDAVTQRCASLVCSIVVRCLRRQYNPSFVLDLFSASTQAVVLYCEWEWGLAVFQGVLICPHRRTNGWTGHPYCLYTDQSWGSTQLPFLRVTPQSGETTLCPSPGLLTSGKTALGIPLYQMVEWAFQKNFNTFIIRWISLRHTENEDDPQSKCTHKDGPVRIKRFNRKEK